MHVAGYIRVSTEQQKEEESHVRQREMLEEWADREDHDITIFEDIAISGQSDERPDYDAMMAQAKDGAFDAVAVRELSRFGRSLQQVLRDIGELQKADVEFISITENFDTDSAMGKAMMQMLGVFNEFWANLARERAQESVERRRRDGDHVGRPWKLDEEQRDEVREWRDKGLTYGQIRTLVAEMYDIEVSRTAIYRYCNGDESREMQQA